MTDKEIKQEIKETYENSGKNTACIFAEKFDIKYRFCEQCDDDMPVLIGDTECLICGQETIKSPHDEDIPLENKEE